MNINYKSIIYLLYLKIKYLMRRIKRRLYKNERHLS